MSPLPLPLLRSKGLHPRIGPAPRQRIEGLFRFLLGVLRLPVLKKPHDDPVVLGIETSCDDTGVAVLGFDGGVRSSFLSSQAKDHALFGGVVPELASRKHQEAIIPLLRAALSEAGVEDPSSQVGLVAVTAGPGLMGSLLVGVMTAKGLSQSWGCPLVGVNHLEGHVFANRIAHEDLKTPFLCLIVSGGHTEVILVKEWGDYALVGRTRDDAAGECYDKVAKMLGLPYPGGPEVDRLAAAGDPDSFDFPVPLGSTGRVEFSFSGLKTAVLWAVNRIKSEGGSIPLADICASFQRAAVGALLGKVVLASKMTGVGRVCLSGGVSANSTLRKAFRDHFGSNVFLPPPELCTDNASMIAAAGLFNFRKSGPSGLDLSPDPSAPLTEEIMKNEIK